VSGLYLLCALIAVGLFGYLLVALSTPRTCDAYRPVLDPVGRPTCWFARRRLAARHLARSRGRRPPATLARAGGGTRARHVSHGRRRSRGKHRLEALRHRARRFNVIGVVAVYALQRLQGVLPLNPQGMAGVEAGSSFNTAVSFVTNTNWQGYGGESTMSYLTQMLALTVQNFLSAATGIAVVWALVRGFVARSSGTVGNFWVDVTRSTLYVLLPLSLLFAVFLVSQGAIQNFDAYKDVTTLEVNTYSQAKNGPDGTAAEGCQGEPVMEEASADPEPADGSDRLAGGDQDARHQRRRAVQRQLGAPVREPDAALQLRADAVDLPDPGGAGVRLRPHGR
jgi:hypothetical protein